MRKIKEDYSLEMLLERNTPFKEKYYKLTRTADEMIAREIKPSPE